MQTENSKGLPRATWEEQPSFTFLCNFPLACITMYWINISNFIFNILGRRERVKRNYWLAEQSLHRWCTLYKLNWTVDIFSGKKKKKEKKMIIPISWNINMIVTEPHSQHEFKPSRPERRTWCCLLLWFPVHPLQGLIFCACWEAFLVTMVVMSDYMCSSSILPSSSNQSGHFHLHLQNSCSKFFCFVLFFAPFCVNSTAYGVWTFQETISIWNTHTSLSGTNHHGMVKVTVITFFSSFWCLVWGLTEALWPASAWFCALRF